MEMATKHLVAAADERREENMEFEIESAEYIGTSENGNGMRMVLKGVPIVNVDWAAIERIVSDSGVDPADAMYLTEHMASKLHELTIGKLFARRAKRIG
jgi:hypothetical protein